MSVFPLFLSVGLTSKTLTDYLLDTLPVYLSFLSACVLFIEVSCKSFLFASFPNYWFYLSVYLSVYPLCLSSIGISAYLSHMCTMHMYAHMHCAACNGQMYGGVCHTLLSSIYLGNSLGAQYGPICTLHLSNLSTRTRQSCGYQLIDVLITLHTGTHCTVY